LYHKKHSVFVLEES